MRPLAMVVLFSACSTTLTTFDDKGDVVVDGYDTGDTTGDDDDFTGDDDDDVTADDDDDVVGDDDDDDTIVGDDDDDTTLPNTPPVADLVVIGQPAGPVTVFVGSQVQVDASGSYDDDGDPLTYFYDSAAFAAARPPTSGVNLLQNGPEAEFLADRPGTYTVYVEVDDGFDVSLAELTITAEEPNLEPVANAGATIRAIVGTIVALDGSASYDPNNDPLTYNWLITQAPGGSAGLITGVTTVSPQLQLDQVGDFKVGLQVTDSGGLMSSIAEVRIISEPEPSTGGSDSCFSCAQANLELERRLSAGDAAGGFGLVLLPLVLLMVQRREED